MNEDSIDPKHRLLAMMLIPTLLVLVFIATACSIQGKERSTAEAAAPASTATSTPDSTVPAPAATHAAQQPAGAARPTVQSPWGIDVAPYAVLGSGRPGKAASDFDKPDGVAFLNSGLLLATDAKNRRIQVWDVQNKAHLGGFGHGVIGGQVVNIAVTPDNKVLVTDKVLNLSYFFEPPAPRGKDEKGRPLEPHDFQFKGTRFGVQGFDELGGIAVDPKGRVYLVDAKRNEVKRFTADFEADPNFHFERARPDGSTYLNGCEGIALDEAQGNLFVASENDSVIQVFDLESGAYKKKLIGRLLDANQPAGTSVFSGSVEGLTIIGDFLLAVDEDAGQIRVFDLTKPDTFNSDLALFNAHGHVVSGYKGSFGHPPLVDFGDKTNTALRRKVKDGSVIPGQANPPGYFCSPDAISSHKDASSGETYIAIADQCNYRIAVYRWSDINRAINGATPAANGADGK